jgi:flagellin-like protein
MKNKKGLSAIVTTLIIILLVLVAVGIIWGVVNNLLGKSSGTIETSTRCLDVDLRATKVVQGSASTTYNVTLLRSPSGDGEVGAKLRFSDKEGNTAPVVDFGTMLGPFDKVTEEVDTGLLGDGGLENATSVEVLPYFKDDSGQEQFCPSSTTFDFVLQQN